MRYANSTEEALPNLRPAGFLILVGSTIVLGGLLVSQFVAPPYVFGAIALALSVPAVFVEWPYGALLLMFIASVLPRFSVGIGGWNARPEHYAVALVLVVGLFRWTFGARPKVFWTKADWFLVAYLAMNYVSSAFFSPDPKQTLRWALLNTLAVAPYFLIRFVVTNDRVLGWAFRVFLTIGIFESAYALVCFAGHHALGTSLGVEIDQYAIGAGGVFGTQYEPNLLGSYSGSLAIMLLVWYFLSKRRPAWLLPGIILSISAMVLTLGRAPVLSFVVVLILLILVGVRMRVVRFNKVLPLAITSLLIVPVISTGASYVGNRFRELNAGGIYEDYDTMGRLVTWAVAFGGISEHPLMGNGTASFQLLADAKQLPILGDRPWLANTLIRIVHDIGLVGLALFGLVLWGTGKQLRNIIRWQVGAARGMVIALFAGWCVYALAFMSTDGTMLAFFWVHMGLLASASAPFRTL
jgi:O-antigen ligase